MTEPLLTNAEAINAFVSHDDRIDAVARAQHAKTIAWLTGFCTDHNHPFQPVERHLCGDCMETMKRRWTP